MSALIPTSVPIASEVTPGQFEVGLPPRASAPALFGAQLNALLGWRGLRDGCRHHQLGEADEDYAASGTYVDPPRIEIHRGPVSNTLWLGISLIAEERLTGDVPEVSAQIETEAGAVIDGPVTWSFDNGLLPASPTQIDIIDRRVAGAGISAEEAWGELWLDEVQGDAWVNSGFGRGAVVDEPRLLELADTVAPAWGVGDAVYLRVTATVARIYSVSWAEGWLAHLPDGS